MTTKSLVESTMLDFHLLARHSPLTASCGFIDDIFQVLLCIASSQHRGCQADGIDQQIMPTWSLILVLGETGGMGTRYNSSLFSHFSVDQVDPKLLATGRHDQDFEFHVLIRN